MDDRDIEAIAKRVAIIEARMVVSNEFVKREAERRSQDAKTWKAISDLQTLTTRLETVVDYQERRQSEVDAQQRSTEQSLATLRVEQAREAGRMGAIAGITSSVIVAVIIQLALAVTQ